MRPVKFVRSLLTCNWQKESRIPWDPTHPITLRCSLRCRHYTAHSSLSTQQPWWISQNKYYRCLRRLPHTEIPQDRRRAMWYLHLKLIVLALSFSALGNAFPSYQSLVGMSNDEVDLFIREHGGMSLPGAQPLPPPQTDNSSKLVNDPEHPFMVPGPNDLRGPCPGLNTLANHGVSISLF